MTRTAPLRRRQRGWCTRIRGTDGRLYASVCDYRGGELVVVEGVRRQVVATVPVGAPIRDITPSPDGAVAHVLAHHPHGAAAVIRIDLARRAVDAVVEVSESATLSGRHTGTSGSGRLTGRH